MENRKTEKIVYNNASENFTYNYQTAKKQNLESNKNNINNPEMLESTVKLTSNLYNNKNNDKNILNDSIYSNKTH